MAEFCINYVSVDLNDVVDELVRQNKCRLKLVNLLVD